MFSGAVRGIAACLIVLGCVSSAFAHALLADAADNKAWHAPDGAAEVVLVSPDAKQAARLVLAKAPLRDAALTLTIETDAKQISLRSGDALLQLPPPTSPLALTLDASAASPKLLVNGENPAPLRGKWIAICLDKKQTQLAMEFTGVTYATVKLSGPAAEAQPASASTAPASPAPRDGEKPTTRPLAAAPGSSAAAPRGDAADMISRLQSGVAELHTKDAGGDGLASGTCFVISDDGRALTNFHVICGAGSATATFVGVEGKFPVELLEADPTRDLALVRITLSAGAATVHPAVLQLADDPPSPGTEVWAMGYPLGIGFAVNKGVVNGVRTVNELPRDFEGLKKVYAPDSKWVQTDCTINHGNSGGPLVDARGRVVGINTWGWELGHSLYFALLASQARAMSEMPVREPLTFEGALRKYKDRVEAERVTKLPAVAIPPTATAAEVAAAARAFRTGIIRPCSQCRGAGTVRKSVQVDTRQVGPYTLPVKKYVDFKCDECEGVGAFLATEEAAGRLITTFVSKLAGVKTTDPALQDQIKIAHDLIAQSLRLSPKVRALVTRSMRGLTSQKNLKPGTPIAVAGRLEAKIDTAQGQRIFYVAILDSTEMVALYNPAIADSSASGAVLVGGVYAGPFTSPRGEVVKLLQSGFIIEAP